MQLDPTTYTCPEHQVDLTERVREVLDDEGVEVAFGKALRLGRRPPEPFEVPVTCPGGDGKSPHRLICAGEMRR